MSMHHIELATRDGQQLSFECGEHESLLAGAARHGITLPALCGQGSCGACRGHCSEGAYHLGEHNPAALPQEAAERGEVLLCSTFPRSALRIAVDADRAGMEAGPVPERQASISALEAVGGGVMRLELKLEPDDQGGSGATFEPGQYAELSPPDRSFSRAYSIANTPNWDGRLEFYIRLQPGGRFSSWLRRARPGDALHVRGPSGSFTLDDSGLGERWFVAGGTGLAPVLSMLRWMAELQDLRPARLYFGVNDASQLFAHEELEELKTQLPGLKLELCLWHGDGQGAAFVGTPAEALERDLAAALGRGLRPDLYVCGPPALIDAVDALAQTHGLGDTLRSERFLPS